MPQKPSTDLKSPNESDDIWIVGTPLGAFSPGKRQSRFKISCIKSFYKAIKSQISSIKLQLITNGNIQGNFCKITQLLI
jgi:hypothetical protein